MPRSRKLPLAGLLVAAGTLLLIFWPKKPAESIPEILRATPAGASQVAYLDLIRLRSSGFLQKLNFLAPEIPVDPEYAEFVQNTGFDYTKDLDRVLMVQSASEATHAFFLAQGRFDRERITRYVMQSGGIARRGEIEIFLIPSAPRSARDEPGQRQSTDSAGEKPEKLALAFLRPDRVALGRSEGFDEWLQHGRLEEADPEMFEQLLRVAGSAGFLIGKVPPRPPAISGGISSPQWEQILHSIRWYALAVVPQQEQLLVVADITCNTEQDCSELSETLEGLRAVAIAALSQPKPPLAMTPRDAAVLRDLLSRARISAQKNTVRTRLHVDAAWFAGDSAAGP